MVVIAVSVAVVATVIIVYLCWRKRSSGEWERGVTVGVGLKGGVRLRGEHLHLRNHSMYPGKP